MTDSPKTALATFLATTARIQMLLGTHGEVAKARDIVRDHHNAVSRVKITTGDNYYGRDAEPETVEFAKRVREQLKADFIAEGEAKRDARLQEIAAEIRALVSVIPQQAAAASIELGHQARMLQHEAQGGTT